MKIWKLQFALTSLHDLQRKKQKLNNNNNNNNNNNQKTSKSDNKSKQKILMQISNPLKFLPDI